MWRAAAIKRGLSQQLCAKGKTALLTLVLVCDVPGGRGKTCQTTLLSRRTPCSQFAICKGMEMNAINPPLRCAAAHTGDSFKRGTATRKGLMKWDQLYLGPGEHFCRQLHLPVWEHWEKTHWHTTHYLRKHEEKKTKASLVTEWTGTQRGIYGKRCSRMCREAL